MDSSKKMYLEFIKKYDESVEDLTKLLSSDKFADFSLACHYLSQCGYEGGSQMPYEEERRMRDLANAKIRERFGTELAEMFDMIVQKSKQELWCGDELFKLFDYNYKPYYVSSCLKSALSVMALMKKGISTVDEVMTVSSLVQHPLYWDIYENHYDLGHSMRAQLHEDEINAWRNIAKLLFDGKVAEAFDYMQNRHRSKYGSKYGDNFHSINLDKFPKTA